MKISEKLGQYVISRQQARAGEVSFVQTTKILSPLKAHNTVFGNEIVSNVIRELTEGTQANATTTTEQVAREICDEYIIFENGKLIIKDWGKLNKDLDSLPSLEARHLLILILKGYCLDDTTFEQLDDAGILPKKIRKASDAAIKLALQLDPESLQ